jgi:CzcA family heavy metal efflux pump
MMPNNASLRGPRTMMRSVVGASLRFRYLVMLIAAAIMVGGVAQLPSMRVEVFPEFAPPRVEIQTACLGLSTADVESLVTVPLEQALNGIKGLEDLRSKSVPQLSSIQLIFTGGTDLFEARQLVQERLATVTASLPTWAAPPFMLPPVSATSRAVQIGMTSQKHSLIAMSMMAYWTVRARLLRVPGVANVALWGERLQMMQVHVQPEKMRQQGVTLDTVMEATADSVDSGLLKFSNGAIIGTGGLIDTPGQRISTRRILPIVTPTDLGRVPLRQRNGKTLTIKDVAQVVEGHQPLIGDAVIGDQSGLLMVVEKLPWADTVSLTKGVEQALQSLQPGLPDITFSTTIFQQARFVETSIRNLREALALGFLLVLVILALFLFEWRVAFISLITIPLSLVTAIVVLRWQGATVNTMTLAGLVIALGAMVDDAIIDIENIVRRLRQHRRDRTSNGPHDGTRDTTASTARVILDASLEVRAPIVYATLITIAAAIPVFLLQGLTGAFFRPLAWSYALAILASMVVALTVTPALALIMLRGVPVERRESPLVRWLQRGYTRVLSRVVRRPRRSYALFGVVTVCGLLVLPHLGQSLFPTFKERDFLVHWISVPGTSAEEVRRTTIDLSRKVESIPGVRSFGSHIGQAFLGEEIAGVNFGEAWVSVDDSVDLEKTVQSIKSVVDSYPGIYHDVLTYLNERIEEVLTGSKEPIVVRVYGQDLDVIRKKAEEVRAVLGGVPGVVDDHVDLQVDVPQIEVEVDLTRAARWGLTPGDVRRAAATLVAGEEVGDIFRDGKAYDVMVWSTPNTRASVSSVAALPIDTPSGRTVTIGEVADVRVRAIPNLIERQGDSRRIDIVAGVEGRDLGAVASTIEKRLSGVSFPRGYHAELLGEYRERQAAQSRLLSSALIAVGLIMLLLQASFGSWRQAIFVVLTLPMALVGGLLAAWLGGGIISLGSLVGFFTVFGIAARNGILLVDHCRHLENNEGEEFGPALVLRGARERLSPILMTSLATGLALVPLIVFGDRPGHEIEYPLAVVIVGGLVTSTLLTLFVVPSLYLRFGSQRTIRRLPGGTP